MFGDAGEYFLEGRVFAESPDEDVYARIYVDAPLFFLYLLLRPVCRQSRRHRFLNHLDGRRVGSPLARLPVDGDNLIADAESVSTRGSLGVDARHEDAESVFAASADVEAQLARRRNRDADVNILGARGMVRIR